MKRLIVLLGVMAVSLSPVFVRLSTAPSMVLVLYRVAFATLILTPYVLLRCRAELRGMKRRELLHGGEQCVGIIKIKSHLSVLLVF